MRCVLESGEFGKCLSLSDNNNNKNTKSFSSKNKHLSWTFTDGVNRIRVVKLQTVSLSLKLDKFKKLLSPFVTETQQHGKQCPG